MAGWKYVKEYNAKFITEAEDLEQEKWLDVLRERFWLQSTQNRVLWKLRFEVLSRARTLAEAAGDGESLDSLLALIKATLEKGDFPLSTWEMVRSDIQVRKLATSVPDLHLGPLSCAVSCALWIAGEHLLVVADPYQRRDHLFGVFQAANFIAPWMGPRAIDAWRAELRPMFEAVIDSEA